MLVCVERSRACRRSSLRSSTWSAAAPARLRAVPGASAAVIDAGPARAPLAMTIVDYSVAGVGRRLGGHAAAPAVRGRARRVLGLAAAARAQQSQPRACRRGASRATRSSWPSSPLVGRSVAPTEEPPLSACARVPPIAPRVRVDAARRASRACGGERGAPSTARACASLLIGGGKWGAGGSAIEGMGQF